MVRWVGWWFEEEGIAAAIQTDRPFQRRRRRIEPSYATSGNRNNGDDDGDDDGGDDDDGTWSTVALHPFPFHLTVVFQFPQLVGRT